jgi:signal transduction histidine kinase
MARAASIRKDDPARTRRIKEDLERRHRTVDGLLRFTERIGASLDPGEIAGELLASLSDTIGAERISLFLIASDTKRFEPYRVSGLSPADPPAAIDAGSAFAAWLREAGGPVRITEYCLSSYETQGGAASRKEEGAARRLADSGLAFAVALGGRGDLVGFLFFSGPESGDDVSEVDIDFAAALARLASAQLRAALANEAVRASALERDRFSGMRRAFIGHAARQSMTSLGVLKSALWSLEPEESAGGVLVDMAKGSVLRLQGTLDNILALNDIDLDMGNFNLERSEVSSLVEDVLRGIIPELEEKQLRVSFDDRAGYRTVLLDEGKMTFAIRSMLDAVVDMAARGDEITISTRVNEDAPAGLDRGSRASAKGPYLALAVSCDGTDAAASTFGIAPSILDSPAESPEHRTDAHGESPDGLEAKLAVWREVVAGHGGMIFLHRESGRGALISIWLPICT